jgi:hypothetical protein
MWKPPAVVAEYAFTFLVAAAVLGFGIRAWGAYEADIRPFARVVPTFTPTPVPDPEKARAEGRRLRLVLDGLGAANAFRAAGQREWAIERYREVLQVDPGNLDARAGLRDLGVIPPPVAVLNTPVPSPTPLEPTNTPTRR